jgi:hypothetical protein
MVHRFAASRLSPGNRLFPSIIEVSERHVTRIKASFASRVEETISLRQVSSVTVRRGAMWSDVIVHSSGGTDPLRSSGHPAADAERLKRLIEEYQTNIQQLGVADPSGLRACPRCAELVKAAAQVCRYCGGVVPIELTEEAAPDEEDEPAGGWSWR